MNKSIDEIVASLIEVIKQSESYQEYVSAREKVENDSDLISKIDEIRNLNLRIRSIQNSDEAFDEMDRLEKRCDELSEDQRVYDFIEAENQFMGMYQEISRRILEEIKLT